MNAKDLKVGRVYKDSATNIPYRVDKISDDKIIAIVYTGKDMIRNYWSKNTDFSQDVEIPAYDSELYKLLNRE